MQFVRGAGLERAQLLAKLGLVTVRDLLWNLPRDVLDLTDVRPVQRLEEDVLQTVRGVVVDMDARQLSGGRTMSAVLLDCDGQYCRGVWFNQRWVLQKFEPGRLVLFSGKPKKRGGRWEFPHPRIQWLEDEDSESTGGLLPRYGLTEGLKMHEMRRMMRSAAEEYAPAVVEHLPGSFRDRENLPRLGDAIRSLHMPQRRDEYDAGRRRLIFDDLLEFQAGLALRRRAWKHHSPAPPLPATAKVDARIRRLFPFAFTAGQDKAVREITADLARDRAMHRLLQADVGAGKTAIAIYAMLVAIAAGHQAVLMAPTEVLASQHWATMEQALSHSRVKRQLLTGNLTAGERRQALADIARGETQLIVGTQAVIQQDVRFDKLGLVVIDEQHKFGVEQRARFSQGETAPHVLVMTATPIPRSLCLTQFGDLDVTALSEMPPGRQRVVTSRVTGPEARRRAFEFVRKQLRAGRQAYVVCPRVEERAEDSGREVGGSAEQMYRLLKSGEMRDFSVGLVHGQMDRKQKAEAGKLAQIGFDLVESCLQFLLGLFQVVQLFGWGVGEHVKLDLRLGAARAAGNIVAFGGQIEHHHIATGFGEGLGRAILERGEVERVVAAFGHLDSGQRRRRIAAKQGHHLRHAGHAIAAGHQHRDRPLGMHPMLPEQIVELLMQALPLGLELRGQLADQHGGPSRVFVANVRADRVAVRFLGAE